MRFQEVKHPTHPADKNDSLLKENDEAIQYDGLWNATDRKNNSDSMYLAEEVRDKINQDMW